MSSLEFRDLSIRYGRTTVVDSFDLTVPKGRIVGLVGESGCGKSSVARAAAGLQQIHGGSILLDGSDVTHRRERPSLQMVFQDPYGSLDPRMTIGGSIAEALPRSPRTSRAERRAEIARLLRLVGLDAERAEALPAQLSGGQCQRVGIARALAARPGLVIADEITSALDASVQGAVLNLVRDLRRTLGIGMLFISHNMAVVRFVSDSVAVMREGRIIEHGPVEELFGAPTHPYTRQLLTASRLQLDAADPRAPAALSPAAP